MKANRWKLRRIFEKIDAKLILLFLYSPKFIDTLSGNMLFHISHIPLRNPSTVKYIYGAVSRNSARVRFQKPAKAGIFKKNDQVPIGGYPDISRPHQDGCGCEGRGCILCW
jgi:hypothetical protein